MTQNMNLALGMNFDLFKTNLAAMYEKDNNGSKYYCFLQWPILLIGIFSEQIPDKGITPIKANDRIVFLHKEFIDNDSTRHHI